jgi:ribosomal protein S18 acetylase RimI-like enzyme
LSTFSTKAYSKIPLTNPLPVIREYKDCDKSSVIALLRLNTPAYFSQLEESDLIYYLDYEVDRYFVLELDNSIVGCGGINFSADRTFATLSWDIVHPNHQGKSLGSMLLNYRLENIAKDPRVKDIKVRTSQLVYKFYEKNGSKLIKIVKDYWAEGFDLYEMVWVKV